ncbi:MAG: type I-U CRISPR-associated helicase/endonuclease Cas3 [Gemmataceae bacterium]|jgi:CRISPR-associated endonuclease/helicase Cas3|nr:type I-U CRISPR-associated helicase/endonuclease Cas3 [Gemmataceae bacterium]
MSDLFTNEFKNMTGYAPFRWQRALYEDWFQIGKIPKSCHIPTGLGKTSVIAIWLIALANNHKVPRRLVYVVNRRTVVDQTTDEVQKYATRLPKNLPSLAISTLRGQFADNRQWSADPSVPAVICGTVDMIGSRLLFSGYGLGFKSRPLHAGFLGQDVLLVHDEAHLEPAFQKLIEEISNEQNRAKDLFPIQVMELTATSRSGQSETFELTHEDFLDPIVEKRVKASKNLKLHSVEKAKVTDTIAELARQYEATPSSVIIFLRSVNDVKKVMKKLPAARTTQLTGTMRGYERDKLIQNPIFQRFLPHAPKGENTVYLVCTSAGEVGVNISADHLVSDLSTFESMTQRFGRVNRFGDNPNSEIHVVYSNEIMEVKEEEGIEARLKLTLELLTQLNGSASPYQLNQLDPKKRLLAFAPQPEIFPVTDVLLDRWVLTTITEEMPGRPDVEPFLHGKQEDSIPETTVVWRQEVEELPILLGADYSVKEVEKIALEILEEYSLKPQELLKDITTRVFDWIKKIAVRSNNTPVWVVSQQGQIRVTTLEEISQDEKENFYYKTLILPPSIGGLSSEGLLDEDVTQTVIDVADEIHPSVQGIQERKRVWDKDEIPEGMKVIFEFRQRIAEGDEETQPRIWYWCEQPYQVFVPNAKSRRIYSLCEHLNDSKIIAEGIVNRLGLPKDLAQAIVIAAQFHDLGKARKLWQRGIGNSEYPEGQAWAKSNRRIAIQENHHYRHEFGSLLDIRLKEEFIKLSDEMKDLVLHLIAAHHGRARPHFPEEEAYDPEAREDLTDFIVNIPKRFAKLQSKYGRWGLAYLESIVRATDIKASRLAEEEPKS